MQTMNSVKEDQIFLPLSKINPELNLIEVNKRTGDHLAVAQGGKIMKKCTMASTCPFFNDQLSKRFTAEERNGLKKKYCGGGSSQCARYIVAKALGLDEVPETLFPSDYFKVNVLLEI